MKNYKLPLGIAAVLLGSVASSSAVAYLTVFSGGDSLTINLDNALVSTTGGATGFGDLDPDLGGVSLSGSLAGWSFTSSSASTKPLEGTATSPSQVLDFTARSAGAGTITMLFSDSDYGPVSGSGFVDASWNLTGAGAATATYEGFYDAGNAVPGPLSNSLFSMSPTGAGSAEVTSTGFSFPADASFSLTSMVSFTHTAGGTSSVDGDFSTVPDGGTTVSLMGLALLGVGGARRFLRK